MKKVHRKLTEEENSSQCLKVLAQVTTEKTRMGAGILRQRQQTYFDERLCYLKCSSFFFLQRPTKERWNRLRDKHGVQFPKCSNVTLAS